MSQKPQISSIDLTLEPNFDNRRIRLKQIFVLNDDETVTEIFDLTDEKLTKKIDLTDDDSGVDPSIKTYCDNDSIVLNQIFLLTDSKTETVSTIFDLTVDNK